MKSVAQKFNFSESINVEEYLNADADVQTHEDYSEGWESRSVIEPIDCEQDEDDDEIIEEKVMSSNEVLQSLRASEKYFLDKNLPSAANNIAAAISELENAMATQFLKQTNITDYFN